MKLYRQLNILFGWIVFAIAMFTYGSTIEPTASFWDCGEFIASGYKLEVGHPPGAPFFMLVANFFSQFASGPSTVAYMVNMMSAFFSALTILFLFWSITYLARKVVVAAKEGDGLSVAQMITILASGVVGALAYTWSDTFWFSAVEGEVYAFSSLFTAVVFWMILKWDDVADEPHADRWIILIAYMMGLSIGVHLLNLLCIPAMVLVYYFRKYPQANLKGTVVALLVSFAIVALMMYGLIQGLVKVAGWFELFFVNTVGLPFQSGVIIYLLAVSATLVWGVWETVQEKSPLRMKAVFVLAVSLMGIPFIGSGAIIGLVLIAVLSYFLYRQKSVAVKLMNTVLLCLMVIFIGYSSYALIVIRSMANTPMDQNSPEDIFTLGSYLNREQYGDRPLIYGKTFASEVKMETRGNECYPVTKQGSPIYVMKVKASPEEKDQYIVAGNKFDYVMDSKFDMLFPRMYSKEGRHVDAYKMWGDIKGVPISHTSCGESKTIMKPTFGENLRFFFSYQVNFMYWRYFMWNFVGRQNDIQGHGEAINGNWISGISFIDNLMVGSQDNLPPSMADNKGRNVFFFLPLLLGLIGLLYQAYAGNKGIQGFWVVFFLFFMTGLAIVIYLNQTPEQPRERDYAYAGSFYAFTIWIGLGVAGIAQFLEKYMNKTVAASVAALVSLFVPLQMVSQTWDDHDRSDRYPCRDFGYNYLIGCPPNSVIFSNGDNDTFPLWYNQEVEGTRTDMRVCNLQYLQTDWYIDQMRRPAYESAPLQISMTTDQYQQGKRDVAYIINVNGNKPLDLQTAMAWLLSEDDRTKKLSGRNDRIYYLPSDSLTIKVDKEAVIRAGIVAPEDSALIVDEMVISLKGRSYITKADIAILNMLANNDWTRPIMFAVTIGNDNNLDLHKYFRLEGLAYRLVPLSNAGKDKLIDTEKMFDNFVNKYRWGGLDAGKDIYVDETFMNMSRHLRIRFGMLISALIDEGKNDKALIALERCEQVLPKELIPYDVSALTLGESYYRIGENEKGDAVMKTIADMACDLSGWYAAQRPIFYVNLLSEVGHNLAIIQHVIESVSPHNPELAKFYSEKFDQYRDRYLSSRVR